MVITSSIGDGLPKAAARRLFEIEEAGDDFNQLGLLARGPCHVATLWQDHNQDNLAIPEFEAAVQGPRTRSRTRC